MRTMIAGLLLVLSLVPAVNAAEPAPVADKPFRVQQQYLLGGSGGWDYLTIDPSADRLFISRADRVLVMSTLDGSVVKTISDTAGVHGIALAPDLGKGFTSNGRADTVTVFDLKSLQTTGTIAVVGHNPDAILYDRASGHLYTFNGRSQDISVIDPVQGKVIAHIAAGGKPEFAATDDAGHLYVNIEDTSRILSIDTLSSKLAASWALPNCEEPTGLAYDAGHRRLFSVCHNGVLAVTDASTGRHVADVPIGKGPDAAAFDAQRNLVFSSNGQDGTLTVVREDDPDHYSVVANVATQTSARTMALDAHSHLVYLVAADFGPAPAPTPEQPHPRAPVLDGSFKVLVVGN